jgi:hypothetical protein
MTSPLVRPQPRRIVPKAVVDALVVDADREISALERQAEAATTAAFEAEAELEKLDTDERSSAWATIQLERFVTSLRADVELEAKAIVQEAQVRARVLVEEARAEVEAERAHRAMFDFDPPEPPAATATDTDTVSEGVSDGPPAVSGDAIFHEIAPESLGNADTATFGAPETEFWSAEPERRRRFPRPNRRVVVTQGLALALVATAAVVRFA